MNTTEHEGVREHYGIAGLPTVLVTKPGGEELDRTLGFLEAKEFIKTAENYQKGIGTLAALHEEVKAAGKSTDPELLFRLGEKYYQHARYKDADIHFESIRAIDSENKSGYADDALYNRILCARKMEDWNNGIGYAEILMSRWPKSEFADDAAIYVGFLSNKAGRKDRALTAYRDYLKKWPKGEDADYAKEQIKALESEKEEKSKG